MLDLDELNGILKVLIFANSPAFTENNTDFFTDPEDALIEVMVSNRDQPISMFSKNKKIKNAEKSIAELGFKKWMNAADKKDYSLMRMHIRQTTNDLCRLHVGDVSMDIIMDKLEPLFNNLDDFEKLATDEGAVLFEISFDLTSQTIRRELYTKGLFKGTLH